MELVMNGLQLLPHRWVMLKLSLVEDQGLYFVGCLKHVNKLLNHPIMGLLVLRMGGTRANMISKCIQCKKIASTCRGDNVVMS